jgi:hypothetical protein
MSRSSVSKSRKLVSVALLDSRCPHDFVRGSVSNGTAEVGYRTAHSGYQRKDEFEKSWRRTSGARAHYCRLAYLLSLLRRSSGEGVS